MGDDEDAICKQCGATADDHFTAWENGMPVVGSYKDAPNGRICSPVVVERAPVVVDQEACQLEWFEARGQAFCNTHRRYELDCVKEKLCRAADALNKIHVAIVSCRVCKVEAPLYGPCPKCGSPGEPRPPGLIPPTINGSADNGNYPDNDGD